MFILIHDDIIREICQWLNCEDRWYSCRAVNKTWRRISLMNAWWEQSYKQTWDNAHFPTDSDEYSDFSWSFHYIERRRYLAFSSTLELVNETQIQQEILQPPNSKDDRFLPVVSDQIEIQDKDNRCTSFFKSLFQRILDTDQKLQRRLLRGIVELESDSSTYESRAKLAKLALHCFKLLRMKPDSVDALYCLAKVYSSVSMHSRALIYASECISHISLDDALIEMSIEKTPSKLVIRASNLLSLLGIASFKLRNYRTALFDLDRAIEIGYNRFHIQYYRMLNYLKLNHMDKVLEDVKDLEGNLPSTKTIPYGKIGEWLFTNGNYLEARKYLAKTSNDKNKLSVLQRFIIIDYSLKDYESVLSHMNELHYYLMKENKVDIFRNLQEQFRKPIRNSNKELGIQSFTRGDILEALKYFCHAVIVDARCMRHECISLMTSSDLKVLFGNEFVKAHRLVSCAHNQFQQQCENMEQLAKSYYHLLYALFYHWLSLKPEFLTSSDVPNGTFGSRNPSTLARLYLDRAFGTNPRLSIKVNDW